MQTIPCTRYKTVNDQVATFVKLFNYIAFYLFPPSKNKFSSLVSKKCYFKDWQMCQSFHISMCSMSFAFFSFFNTKTTVFFSGKKKKKRRDSHSHVGRKMRYSVNCSFTVWHRTALLFAVQREAFSYAPFRLTHCAYRHDFHNALS